MPPPPRHRLLATLLALLALPHSSPGQGWGGAACPEAEGRWPDPVQCDAYLECRAGVATPSLCPDGLLFSPERQHHSYPCVYPPEADCQGRTSTQPAQPTEECPHQFGYYPLGGPTDCGGFFNCVHGKAFRYSCPEGLAFSELTLRCEWPDQAPNCDAEGYLGFSCPPVKTLFGSPPAPGYTLHPSPYSCQRYFLCLEGRPRLLVCPNNKAFDQESSTCQPASNVTGCFVPESTPQKFQPFVDPFNNYQTQTFS